MDTESGLADDAFTDWLLERGGVLFRPMPWRDDIQPYYVLVSELMLQQTQVSRVIPKFEAFVQQFPSIELLAKADLADVLIAWQGLGYNRRARYLHEAARMIIDMHKGEVPNSSKALTELPGIGENTAGAILAYAFNQPSVFIETNIRTVYIHHFYSSHTAINDAVICEKLEVTLDRVNPRQFYWALMDYGSWLKTAGVRTNSKSTYYSKQSPLKGSVREVRGHIVTQLSQRPKTDLQLRQDVVADERYDQALQGLVKDGLVTIGQGLVYLTK
jgi:A/G-specific adenine glycosylase